MYIYRYVDFRTTYVCIYTYTCMYAGIVYMQCTSGSWILVLKVHASPQRSEPWQPINSDTIQETEFMNWCLLPLRHDAAQVFRDPARGTAHLLHAPMLRLMGCKNCDHHFGNLSYPGGFSLPQPVILQELGETQNQTASPCQASCSDLSSRKPVEWPGGVFWPGLNDPLLEATTQTI